MRWSGIVQTSTRVTQIVAAVALTIMMSPDTLILLAGTKWT
jgi:hypothetical protein